MAYAPASCIQLLKITSQPFSPQKGCYLLFVFSPLHQIKALSTEYHIILPTKAGSAHRASLKAAAGKVPSAAAVRPVQIRFYAGCQQKLRYEYDYGDYKHIRDTMGKLPK